MTGGAAGIGRAIVERLTGDGWAVTFVDLDQEAGSAVATDISERGGACRFECADLADRDQRRGLVARTVEAWGGLKLLVNNAAYVGARLSLMELTEEDWDRVMETNLTATAFLTRDAARAMHRGGGGSIVNMATIQELLPLPTHVSYVASKGGISALTRSLAVELGPYGIRVNAVVPGVIQTHGMAEEREHVGLGAAVQDGNQPSLLPRLGMPEDVAGAVAFLASTDAAFVTGSTVTVDGGRSLSRKPDPLAEGLTTRTGQPKQSPEPQQEGTAR
ncbi:SDR family NAD(P)-dependent oxidoreductase [Sinomonas sp. P47F7]|uniref:SDR family NAD(P)-dependent oxidoreductase n=1 Tax=Sinomonas sp. P47F7 TaxID=3410987 RepID=UPI003BF5F566